MDILTINTVFSAEELMAQGTATGKLVDNLLPEGLTVLSGAPKIGKSFLSLRLARLRDSPQLQGSVFRTLRIKGP